MTTTSKRVRNGKSIANAQHPYDRREVDLKGKADAVSNAVFMSLRCHLGTRLLAV